MPGVNNYSWDAAALTGYASINTAEGDCGAAAESVAIPFTLTKTGSGPVQYPDAPIYAQPDAVAPAPAPAEGAPAPTGAMPAEQDPRSCDPGGDPEPQRSADRGHRRRARYNSGRR